MWPYVLDSRGLRGVTYRVAKVNCVMAATPLYAAHSIGQKFGEFYLSLGLAGGIRETSGNVPRVGIDGREHKVARA